MIGSDSPGLVLMLRKAFEAGQSEPINSQHELRTGTGKGMQLGANRDGEEHARTAVSSGTSEKQFVKKFVSEQWILSCLPLVIDLSTTCNPHFPPKNAM